MVEQENRAASFRFVSELSRPEDVRLLVGARQSRLNMREILETLSQNKDLARICADSGNPNTSPEVLLEGYLKVMGALASGEVSISGWDRSAYEYCLINTAKNRASPKMLLNVLARDRNPEIFCAVAGNPAAPPETLRKLHEDMASMPVASSQSEYCLEMIAGNPSTPKDLLLKLSRATDARTSENARKTLSRTSDAGGHNPAAGPAPATNDTAAGGSSKISDLASLGADGVVALAIAQNKSTPADVLERFSQDERAAIRLGVASNRETPVHVLKRLLSDEESMVCFAAEITLNTLSLRASRGGGVRDTEMDAQQRSEASEGDICPPGAPGPR